MNNNRMFQWFLTMDKGICGHRSCIFTVVSIKLVWTPVVPYQVPLTNCKPPLRRFLNCKPPLNGVNARFELSLQDTLFIVTNELFRFI